MNTSKKSTLSVNSFVKTNLPVSILPNAEGFYGTYGGQFVPQALKDALNLVAENFMQAINDPKFIAEFEHLSRNFSGRPTPIFECKNLSRKLGGARIIVKREDLNHLGAHKLNNVLGQVLLAKRMGKKHIIAETGAGQHGTAAAATAAFMDMTCDIYMGEEDIKRQAPNVKRMEMFGARVIPAMSGQRTLKEAVDEALDAYAQDLDNAFYVLGSVTGPHPYPLIVSYFQSVISREARQQMLDQHGQLPDAIIACVGGGSNAMGAFSSFIEDESVELFGVEPGGRGTGYGENAASISLGTAGIMHGFRSYVLMNEHGEPASVHSCSAGLDYPSVGPQHALLKDIKRATYVQVSDEEAQSAFHEFARCEGIIPALESAHAIAYAIKIAPNLPKDKILLINLSGRGDKDL